jgi:hypothetical protein
MAAIKKIQIKRQVYRFDLRKKYSNRKKYTVIPRPPIDAIAGELRHSLQIDEKGVKRLAKFGIVALVALLLGVLALSSFIFRPPAENGSAAGLGTPIYLDSGFTRGGIASIGYYGADNSAGYFYYYLNATGVDYVNVSAEAYPGRIPTQVFLYRTGSYPEFAFMLRNKLSEYGIAFSEISADELSSLPAGSLLIIAQDNLPGAMAAPGNANLLSMARRGVDILYIGNALYNDRKTSGFVVDDNGVASQMPKKFMDDAPFIFDSSTLTRNNLSLSTGLYTARAGTYSSGSGALIYGIVSVTTMQDWNGFVVFVPNTIRPQATGWTSTDLAARDVAKIVYEMKWHTPSSINSAMLNATGGNLTAHDMFATPAFHDPDDGWTVVGRMDAYSGAAHAGRMVSFFAKPDVNGRIGIISTGDRSGKIISNEYTGGMQSFAIEYSEADRWDGYSNMQLIIQDSNASDAGRVYQIDKVLFKNLQTVDKYLTLEPGTYLAVVRDADKKKYAKMVLEVGKVSIIGRKADFTKSIFRFATDMDGTTPVIKDVKVTVDGKYTYEFANANDITIDMSGDLKGEGLKNGKHTFTFEYGGRTQDIVLDYADPNDFSQTIGRYWYFILLLPVVGLVGFAPTIARLFSKEMYSLDIPDFPPSSVIKIPVRRSAITGLISRINEDYRWKNAPLTLEEIKKGFKKMVHDNKPVLVSDFNLEYVLNQMISEGIIRKELDYYGIAAWEKETGRSMLFMAMQRKIRDICINEAIPFSRPAGAEPWDMVLKVLGQDLAIFLMDSREISGEKLTKATKCIGKGLAVLLFAGPEQKRDFEDTMDSPTKGGGLIKLEIMGGSIVIVAVNELGKLLKDMKSL